MSASTHVSLEDISPGAPPREREREVAALTGLRGFAALMVLVVHVSVRTEYPWLVGLPSFGPVCLFVLSGFLLYRPWARWTLRLGTSPDLRRYSRRRLARIFPAYLFVFLVIALVYPRARPDGADSWFYNLTLTWIYVKGELPLVFQHSWSLCTELSWYVALPVMAIASGLVARRYPPRTALWIVTGLIALSVPITVLWQAWLYADDLGVYGTYAFWLPAYLVCFAGGALVTLYAEAHAAGLVSLSRLRRIASDSWALPLFAVAAALMGTSALGGADGYVSHSFSEDQVRFVAVTLVSLALLVAVVFGSSGSPTSWLMSTRALTTAGLWSYSIYLWHLPIIVILDDKLDYPDAPVADLVFRLVWVLALTLPLSAATYAWIEKPAMEWSARRTVGLATDSRHRDAGGRRIAETVEPIPSPTSSSRTAAQPAEATSAVRTSSSPDE
ncbi:acyltransferase family protein [Nocardioides sp. MAH-18]|uniref:Acyltransferase family protein n=1 Tax=Nocardioides agri TaxID=2682843 RepID=A0A6L6XWF1_9ACTN|nr:acyltransferase family protein [Nocardioides sp. MAH-18]